MGPIAPIERMGPRPEIETRRCTGCGRCVAACAPHVLSLETVQWKKSAVLHAPEACTRCGECVQHCPFDAIAMRSQRATLGNVRPR